MFCVNVVYKFSLPNVNCKVNLCKKYKKVKKQIYFEFNFAFICVIGKYKSVILVFVHNQINYNKGITEITEITQIQ